MNKQYEEITMRRVCSASDVYVEVEGAIDEWPVWAAKAIVAEVARWANDGFHFRNVDSVIARRIGQDMGGHPVMRVAPAVTNGPCSVAAGVKWQAALVAVLAAQRDA